MEHNYLKEFERGPPKEHSCEIWLKNGRTDARRHHAMTIARWPTASGANKTITKADEYLKQLLAKKLLLVTEYQPGVTSTYFIKGSNSENSMNCDSRFN